MHHSRGTGIIPALTVLACVIAAVPALAQGVRLDVQANISTENLLYFEGTVTPRNLVPEGHLQVRNEVDVFVEAIGEDGRFRELPDHYHAAADESYRGDTLLKGEELEGRASELFMVSGQALKPADEDERFGITGTVELGEAERFRIIARLRHTWVGSWPGAECHYDIAGPFAVREGVARKRRGGGFLGDVGRFLERAVSDVGKAVISGAEDAGRFLLGGGDNPLSLLQAVLLGDLEQRGGALGQAIRLIGGAGGAGAALYVIEQLATGDTPPTSDDLTRTVVEALLERHAGDGTMPAIALETGEAYQLPEAQSDADALVGAAVGQLGQSLSESLGLRGVKVDLDATSATVTSEMPGLQGRGHLEPIIAYMLVDAAVVAPWTEVVTAVFDDGAGEPLAISVAAEAARTYARGEIDTESFLQLCRFTDALEGADEEAPVTGTPSQPTRAEAAPPLLAQSRLPAGWLASTTHTVALEDLDIVIPGVRLSEQLAQSAALQVLQAEGNPVTVLGIEMPDEQAATAFTRALAETPGGEWQGEVLRLSTEPVLHAVHHDSRAYLLQGEGRALTEVARLVASDAATETPSAGLAALLPAITAGDQPPEDRTTERPAAEHAPLPEAVSPPRDSYLSTLYLCTGVDGSRPVRLEEALPEGADRLGVYLDIRDAPPGTVLELELWHEEFSLGRRLLSVSGDRRTITYFMPETGFSAGSWWLEVSSDDGLLARLLFEVR